MLFKWEECAIKSIRLNGVTGYFSPHSLRFCKLIVDVGRWFLSSLRLKTAKKKKEFLKTFRCECHRFGRLSVDVQSWTLTFKSHYPGHFLRPLLIRASRKKLIGPRMVSVRYYLFTPFPKITILPPELWGVLRHAILPPLKETRNPTYYIILDCHALLFLLCRLSNNIWQAKEL